MSYKFLDRVQMTVASAPGTGSIALGSAVASFQTFAAAGASNGDTTPYLILDGNNWEFGVGTYSSSGPTLARTTITASTSAGSAITASGSAIVMCTLRAEDIKTTLASMLDANISSPATNAALAYLAGQWTNTTLTAMLDANFSSTQGATLYRGASAWAALGPGTAGQVLQSGGAAANPSWQTPAASGAPGGTAPAMVQFASNNANGAYASVTMGAAPTNGNLLVCVVYSEQAVSPGSGWSQAPGTTGSTAGLWYTYIYTKTAGASESATQTPLSGTSTSYWTAGIWEVSGKNSGIAIWADEQYWSVQSGPVAFTPMMAAFAGSLCLMSFCPSVNQTYTVLNVSGAETVDLNGSALTGAHAVYAHSDSSQAMYGMTGLMTVAAGLFNYAMIIIFH